MPHKNRARAADLASECCTIDCFCDVDVREAAKWRLWRSNLRNNTDQKTQWSILQLRRRFAVGDWDVQSHCNAKTGPTPVHVSLQHVACFCAFWMPDRAPGLKKYTAENQGMCFEITISLSMGQLMICKSFAVSPRTTWAQACYLYERLGLRKMSSPIYEKWQPQAKH